MAFSVRKQVAEAELLARMMEAGLAVTSVTPAEFPQPYKARASKYRLFRITCSDM